MSQLGKLINTLISNSDMLVNQEIADKFDHAEGRKITRRVPINQAADLVGVARQTIYKAVAEGKLAGPLFDGWVTSSGADFYQIDAMREHFKTKPTKDYCPVLSVSGHKGGGWKTTTAIHKGQWLAMKGYRVLMVSMDPQGSLNLAMGLLPDVDVKVENTLLPFFLGERDNAKYAIQKTYFPGLDIIPACLQLARVEDEIAKLGDEGKTRYEAPLLLHEALETVKEDYDVIIVDGPPNLGLGTIMCVFASDVVLCPSPVDRFGFYSTRQYLQMLKELLEPFDINSFEPTLRILGTHYNNANGSDSSAFFGKMKAAWGEALLDHPIVATAQVPIAYDKMRTIYEQTPKERTSYSAYKKATNIFDDVFTEIESKILTPLWGAE